MNSLKTNGYVWLLLQPISISTQVFTIYKSKSQAKMKLFTRSKRKPILPLVAVLIILVLAPAAENNVYATFNYWLIQTQP